MGLLGGDDAEVLLRHREVDDQGEDRGEEDDAGQDRPQAEAGFFDRLGEVVADRGAERPGEDVGEPEGEDRVQLEAEVGDGDDRDRAGEDPGRGQVAEFELLGEEVAGRGAEGEGEEDRQPVEGLAPGGDDGVDREGALDSSTRPRRRARGSTLKTIVVVCSATPSCRPGCR